MLASISRETVIDRRQPMLRWSAVFAGVFVASAIWVLLQLLAVGGGLVSYANHQGTVADIGMGTTVWSLIVPLIALFVGGLVAGRFDTSYSRGIGALHGLIVWAFSTMIGTILTISVLGMLAMRARGIDVVTTANEIQAADATGRTLLYTGVSLCASLLGAVIGGAIGVRRYIPAATRVAATEVVPVEPVPVPPLDGP